MLDSMDVERTVQVALESKNRSRIEQIDKDVTCIMKKSGKKFEVKVIGIKKSKEKQKVWARVLYWKATSTRKVGRCVSSLLIKKRKDVAEIEDDAQLGANEAKAELSKSKAC